MLKQREYTKEEKEKFFKRYWLGVWFHFITFTLGSTIYLNVRLEGNPYLPHTKLAALCFVILTMYYLTFYASRVVKCLHCKHQYFGGNVFNTLRPHKCLHCGK